MSSHRYQYLYLPINQFLSRLSPISQRLFTVAKVALVVALVSFHLSGISSSGIENSILEPQAVRNISATTV
jgi:hypothetical protein